MTEWDDLADWWVDERSDPAYRDDVQPMLVALIAGLSGPTLDLGCGDGTMAHLLPSPVFGCDLSGRLLSLARRAGMAVVRANLPDLDWMREGSVSVASACLVLEHISDAPGFFAAVARVVAPGGSLVVVANHPAFTSAGAGPVVDPSDGEVLWRWGTYMVDSVAAEPAGAGSIVFHHRPLGSILTIAARAGWALDQLIEAGAGPATINRLPGLAGQEQMPRLVGIRWSNRGREASDRWHTDSPQTRRGDGSDRRHD